MKEKLSLTKLFVDIKLNLTYTEDVGRFLLKNSTTPIFIPTELSST